MIVVLRKAWKTGKIIAIVTYCILFDLVNCKYFNDWLHLQLMLKAFSSYFNILKLKNILRI